jgi:hypothetical protein
VKPIDPIRFAWEQLNPRHDFPSRLERGAEGEQRPENDHGPAMRTPWAYEKRQRVTVARRHAPRVQPWARRARVEREAEAA